MSTIDSAGRYRVQGPIRSFSELQKTSPDSFFKIPDAWLEEQKLHDEQMRVREELINRYVQEHPAKIYGQVVVNGQLVATVWDSGTAQTPSLMPNLTGGAGSPLELAKIRLREIAQAFGGEIRYSNFIPLPGGGSEFSGGVVPDEFLASLPPVTARSMRDFLEEMVANLRRTSVEKARQQEAAA